MHQFVVIVFVVIKEWMLIYSTTTTSGLQKTMPYNNG